MHIIAMFAAEREDHRDGRACAQRCLACAASAAGQLVGCANHHLCCYAACLPHWPLPPESAQMAAANALPSRQVVVLEAGGKTTTISVDFADTAALWQTLLAPGRAGTLYVPTLRNLKEREYGLSKEAAENLTRTCRESRRYAGAANLRACLLTPDNQAEMLHLRLPCQTHMWRKPEPPRRCLRNVAHDVAIR